MNENFTAEEIGIYGERDKDNKLIDFPLAALDVDEAVKWFSKNDKITVLSANGNPQYNGKFNVIATKRPYIVILRAVNGTSTSGKVINESRHDGAERGFLKSKRRISEIEGNPEPAEPVANDLKRENPEPKSNTGKWLLLIFLVLFIFLLIKTQKQ